MKERNNKWAIDTGPKQPFVPSGERNNVVDWHVDLVRRRSDGGFADFIVMQFSSRYMDKAEADKLVEKMLAGLNA